MSVLQRLFKGTAGLSPAVRQLQIKVQVVNDPVKKKLLLGFENIGTSCEFGLVQRKYGAEPLGLFRWNTTRPRQLAACLDGNLAGLGEPDNVEIVLPSTGEFMVKDRAWGFAMHTFLYEGETARDLLHKQMSDRLTFLRTNFLDGLESGRKIYVCSWDKLDVPRARLLADALRRHGPTRLLAVTLAGAAHAPAGRAGDIVPIDDHLCYGLLDRVGDQGLDYFNIDYDDWLKVCEKAADLFRPSDVIQP